MSAVRFIVGFTLLMYFPMLSMFDHIMEVLHERKTKANKLGSGSSPRR